MDTKKFKIHPLIALREKYDEELVSVEGYLGSQTDGNIRLYTDLSTACYYEIPEKSILHLDTACKDCGDKSLVMVYLLASLKIKLVYAAKAAHFGASNNPFGPTPSFEKLPTPELYFPLIPSPSCLERCIQSIKSNGAYFSLTPGASTRSIRYFLNEAGKKALYDCFYNCGYRGGLLIFIWQNAIARLEGEANFRQDPPMPDIPEFP